MKNRIIIILLGIGLLFQAKAQSASSCACISDYGNGDLYPHSPKVFANNNPGTLEVTPYITPTVNIITPEDVAIERTNGTPFNEENETFYLNTGYQIATPLNDNVGTNLCVPFTDKSFEFVFMPRIHQGSYPNRQFKDYYITKAKMLDIVDNTELDFMENISIDIVSYLKSDPVQLTAGHTYILQGEIVYRRRKTGGFLYEDAQTMTFAYMLCVNEFGAEDGVFELVNTASVSCSHESYQVNILNGNANDFEVYWSENGEDFTLGENEKSFYRSGTYFYKLHHTPTGSWSEMESVTVEITNKPNTPTLEKVFWCGNETYIDYVFTAQSNQPNETIHWQVVGHDGEMNDVTGNELHYLGNFSEFFLNVYSSNEHCNSQTVPYPLEIIAAEDCQGGFAPMPGKKYVLSAWVKEGDNVNALNYSGPKINVFFEGNGSSITLSAKGNVVEGWQKIEEDFIIPENTARIVISLLNTSSKQEVYFDDIRIHPYYASMVSYVYDLETMRLMAELGGDNYATFYVYDQEGNVIKTKQETKEGIITVGESRSNVKQ